jgi:hypothetical protein
VGISFSNDIPNLSKSIIVECWYITRDIRYPRASRVPHAVSKPGDRKREGCWADDRETAKAKAQIPASLRVKTIVRDPKEQSLRLLRSLGPELHQRVHQSIRTEDENANNGGIPPAIVIILQVDSVEIVASIPKLANTATRRRLRIDEIRA